LFDRSRLYSILFYRFLQALVKTKINRQILATKKRQWVSGPVGQLVSEKKADDRREIIAETTSNKKFLWGELKNEG
jgi:hypothetical protein